MHCVALCPMSVLVSAMWQSLRLQCLQALWLAEVQSQSRRWLVPFGGLHAYGWQVVRRSTQ